jgi:hypothetical protein
LFERCLLGLFGKSKWQSYFELLGNAGPQAQRSHGEAQTTLPLGVSPDTDLFLAMFLICLPPSMQEAVGAGNHKTVAAMVKDADALWDV